MTIHVCPEPGCPLLSSDPRGCEAHRPDTPLPDEPVTDVFDWGDGELDEFAAGDGVHHRDTSVLKILNHLHDQQNEGTS